MFFVIFVLVSLGEGKKLFEKEEREECELLRYSELSQIVFRYYNEQFVPFDVESRKFTPKFKNIQNFID